MNSFNLPLFMSVGEGIVSCLPKEIKSHFFQHAKNKTLLLTSKEMLNLFHDTIDNIYSAFTNLEISIVVESSFDNAVEIAKHICTSNIKLVLGFGGGTVLDTAKYASFVAKASYIAIPTTLSNDGLASPIAVLYAQNKKKKSFGAKIPDGLIIDTGIIKCAPEIYVKAGVGDTMSNYTALYDWKLDCDRNNTKEDDFAYMLSEMSFNTLLSSKDKSLKSSQSLGIVAQALVLSGLAMEIAGNSRPCSGSEHLFSHAMDELFDFSIPHGILVALGSVVSCKLQGRDNSMLINYLNEYGIIISPRILGIKKEDFISAWIYAKDTRPDRFTILNTLDLSFSLFESIYNELLEV